MEKTKPEVTGSKRQLHRKTKYSFNGFILQKRCAEMQICILEFQTWELQKGLIQDKKYREVPFIHAFEVHRVLTLFVAL